MVDESLRVLRTYLHAAAAVHLVVDRIEFLGILAGMREAGRALAGLRRRDVYVVAGRELNVCKPVMTSK